MRRLSFLVLFLLSVFATNVFAENEVNISGGYARLSDKFLSKLEDHGISSGNINMRRDAFRANFDYFYGDSGENVKKGFRVACLQSGKKKFSYDGGTGSLSLSIFYAMYGVKLNYDISEKFSLNGKLFGGIAYGSMYTKAEHYTHGGGLLSIIFMDASVGAQYLLTKKFGLGLDLGYERPFPAGLSGFTATLGLNFKI